MKSMLAISLLLLGLCPVALAVPKQSQAAHKPASFLFANHAPKPKKAEVQPKPQKPPVKKASQKRKFKKASAVKKRVVPHKQAENPPRPKPPKPKRPQQSPIPDPAIKESGTTPLKPEQDNEPAGDDLP